MEVELMGFGQLAVNIAIVMMLLDPFSTLTLVSFLLLLFYS